MAKGTAKSITDGKRFGIVPADVLTDNNISRSARWLFAVLCSHANPEGYCRRSLKRIAKIEGVDRRSVQRWLYELESAGRVMKLNERGKMGVFRVIRHSNEVNGTRARNLKNVMKRRRQFGEYGRLGAAKKARLKGESVSAPVTQVSPSPDTVVTGAGVTPVSHEQNPNKQYPCNSREHQEGNRQLCGEVSEDSNELYDSEPLKDSQFRSKKNSGANEKILRGKATIPSTHVYKSRFGNPLRNAKSEARSKAYASVIDRICRVLNVDKKIAYEITLQEDATDLIPLESKGTLDDSKLLEIIKDIVKK